MNNEFEESFVKRIKSEKEIIGGYLYKNRDYLPSIIIDYNQKEEFICLFEVIRDLSSKFGQYFSILTSNAQKLLEPENQTNDDKDILGNIATKSIGESILALSESIKIILELKSNDKTIIYGDSYIFIIIMIRNLFMNYAFFTNIFLIRQYQDKESLEGIRETLNFLTSQEFEVIRKKINVIECSNILEKSPTIH